MPDKFEEFCRYIPYPFFWGNQRIYKFPNGYGASVLPNRELAVLKGDQITYDTPVTDNVLCCSDEDHVQRTLARIKALKND